MNKIENANIIGLLKNDVIISKIKGENEFIVRYNENQEIIWEKKYINTGNKFICGTKIIIYEGEYTTILDVNTGSFLNKENRYYIKNNCNYIVYFELDNSKELFINGNKIENFSRLKVFGSNKVFFSDINEPFIKSVNFIDNVDLFLFNAETYFHQPAQIMEGRVLVSNNKIIFFAHTEDWSNYATFVLDAQTGQVLFTTQEMGMKLITYNDFVYQIQRKAIKILDPKNLKIETIDVSAYCDERSIFLDDHTVFFYKDKLYTLARGQGSDVYNIWVIFNLKTQLFEHREDMFINPKKKKDEKNKMFINDIQANDNLVAIRCSDNLYIFEKQDIEAK
ncbi:hypothetical protein [uncultured Capnocytophaga sp.]|uniref:hypothetical protein n=1 Tax=uncultured Capnocytophaga sp. TaxID=159273 RepID=UPI002601B431|nr:hypothetical protein [uncultured Capnocytophaga sp.]